MNLSTLCLRGYKSAKEEIHRLIIKEKLDILCLQDLRVNKENFTINFPGRNYESLYHSRYVGFIYRKSLRPKKREKRIGVMDFDREGLFSILEFKKFFLINIYKRPGAYGHDRFIRRLVKLIRRFEKEKYVILVGDFNIGIPSNKTSFLKFKDLHWEIEYIFMNTNLMSIWQFLSKFQGKKSGIPRNWNFPYTYIHSPQRYLYLNDYILFSKELSHNLKHFYVKYNTQISDHLPIIAAFKNLE